MKNAHDLILELLRHGPLSARELVAASAGRLSLTGGLMPALTRLEVEGQVFSTPVGGSSVRLYRLPSDPAFQGASRPSTAEASKAHGVSWGFR